MMPIVIEYDQKYDYCKAAWKKVKKQTPEKFKNFSLNYKGKVGLTPKALFNYTCNKCKDALEKQIKGVIKTIKKETNFKAKAQKKLSQANSELRNAFLAWVAETARPHILPQLSNQDQKKFKTDSEFMQVKAVEYLNSEKELMAYITAYLQNNSPVLFKAQKAYFDMTSGESAAIIKDLKTLIETAKDRLKKINSLTQDAVKDPKTPWADLIKKHDVKGEWIDKAKENEGRLRAMNKKFKLKELVDIIYKSSSSELPRHKVEAMFEFLDTVSGLAADSHIPMASLMAGFVQDLVKVGKELLSQVVTLGDNIHKRAGYCLGTGVATEDPRSVKLDKKGLTLCPLAFEKKPWKNIYTELGSDRLYFWNGKKFIPGQPDGGGKTTVQNIIRFVTQFQELGYKIDRKMDTLATLYNVPFKAGFRGLESHAAEVMEDITQKALEYQQFKKNIYGCTSDRLSSQLQKQFDFNFDAFLKETNKGDAERLETAYIASFLAQQNRLGKNTKKRTAAQGTYDRISKAIKNLRFIHINGQVADENNPDTACRSCNDVKLDIDISEGTEIRGCEVWKTDKNGHFNVYLFSNSPKVSVSLEARFKEQTSGKIPVNTNKQTVHVKLMIPFESSPDDSNQKVALPDLGGMTYEKAVSRLKKLKLPPAGPQIGTPAPEIRQTGLVEKTIPNAGSRLESNSRVTLYLFDEPSDISQIPDVTGLDKSAAVKKVKTAGLIPVIEEGKEAFAPENEGEVYKQIPKGGVEVLPGTRIVLTVYTPGELMGTMPDLKGEFLDKAVGLVRQMGLTPSVELGKQTTKKSFKNIIYKQTPGPGTQTSSGSHVTLWIYDYKPKTYTVPDLIGKKAQTALDSIKAAGLNPVFELGKDTSDANKNGMIYSQSPNAGSGTQKGADIVITVYNYKKKELTVPTILGMPANKATAQLLAKNFEILPHHKGKPAPQKKYEGKISRA
ncbi:MAG: PASTA domain-containing protein [Desulfobacula sp.]|nr:PASTA domain-containing protein [Desulfobacula sp.]